MTDVQDETATPPAADADGSANGSATAAEPKAPKSMKELILASLEKGKDNAKHKAFQNMVKREADIDLDYDTIVLVQAQYGPFRSTPEFLAIKEEMKATPKTPKIDTTDPEAVKAAIEKGKKKREADAKRREQEDAALAELEKMYAELDSADESDDAASATTDGDFR